MRRGLGQVCNPAAGVGGLHDQMKILGVDDRFPLFIFDRQGVVLDPIHRPALAALARPHVDVRNPIDLEFHFG